MRIAAVPVGPLNYSNGSREIRGVAIIPRKAMGRGSHTGEALIFSSKDGSGFTRWLTISRQCRRSRLEKPRLQLRHRPAPKRRRRILHRPDLAPVTSRSRPNVSRVRPNAHTGPSSVEGADVAARPSNCAKAKSISSSRSGFSLPTRRRLQERLAAR
jgi:hypothetical protein